ncbi:MULTISPECIES: hypothetical protein [Pseudomonas]|uniref:hypothetical protein n=1 Tax=Pseudomonas TaxID=286 RepID=UPI000C24F2EE|nr:MULTISPECIES: hypothetical protein [Pseudomonas]MCE0933421.1 hypothetical protein [Pseudomonas monteilii]MCL8308152.1 hypothetical protein [Pseudomonas putida]PJI71352.1 hypothetical protein CSW00_24030 [Pseudomonas sp. MR 02]WJR40761.1 hypothetical protein LU662_007005 [Pseudomonas monteilii]
MTKFSSPAKRVEESLELLAILSEVLDHNGGFKGSEPGEHPAMIGDRGENGIVRAMRVIAWAAHREFCQMATDLEIPQ